MSDLLERPKDMAAYLDRIIPYVDGGIRDTVRDARDEIQALTSQLSELKAELDTQGLQLNKKELEAEDAECATAYLDDLGVARELGENTYSLVGRIGLLKAELEKYKLVAKMDSMAQKNLKEEIETLKQWNSVKKEGYPDPSENPIVLAHDGSYCFEAEFDDGFWCSIGGDEMKYWMPIPVRPSEGE